MVSVFKLTLRGNKNEAVIDKAGATADARVKIDHFHWNVPHYIPSMQHESILSKQI